MDPEAAGMVTSKSNHRLVQLGILVGIWSGITLLATLQAFIWSAIEETTWRPSFFQALRWQIPVWMPWIVLTPVVLWLSQRVSFARGRWVTSTLFHLGVGAAVAMLLTGFLAVYTYTTFSAPPDEPIGQFYIGLLGVRFFPGLLVYSGILGVGSAISYYRKYRERELTTSQLETQLAHAHLQALKMQLHPHFLFNTLHAVSVLIKEDPGAASRMVAQLGDFLRLAIDTVGTQEVPLKEELEFLELYLAIEQTRFQDRLAVGFDIAPDTLGAQVPSFILQPLVENSIKHGIAEHSGEGRISVTSTRSNGRLVLSVEDGGCGRAVPPADTWKDGVGLRTTRERLTRMYGRDHGVGIENVDKGVRVSLTIPYRPEPSAIDG